MSVLLRQDGFQVMDTGVETSRATCWVVVASCKSTYTVHARHPASRLHVICDLTLLHVGRMYTDGNSSSSAQESTLVISYPYRNGKGYFTER